MIYFPIFCVFIITVSFYMLFQNKIVYRFKAYANKQWFFYANSAVNAIEIRSFEKLDFLLQESRRFLKFYDELPSYNTMMNPFKYHPKKIEQMTKDFDKKLEREYQDYLRLL